jgi:heme exporter protein C
MPAVYLWPLFLMWLGYMTLFGSLWLVRIRTEVWRRKAGAVALAAAGA